MEYSDLSLVPEILKDAGADERMLATCPRVASLLYDLGDLLESVMVDVQRAMEGAPVQPDAHTLPVLLSDLSECVEGAGL